MASKSKKSVVAALAVGKPAEMVREARPAQTVREARPTARYAALDLESLVDLGRENIAALAKANLALSEGMQALGQELLTYARSSFESASQAASALFEAKTIDELIQVNSDLARSSFETLCAHSAKLSGMGVSIASETLAPLGGRVEAAFARLAKPAAA